MEKFVLNITASSGEFFQGECESLTLPTADGQYRPDTARCWLPWKWASCSSP